MELDFCKQEEEFKNSIQSSIASALWESSGSAYDLDLGKLEEETFPEDLFMDIKFSALATFAPIRFRNLSAEEFFDDDDDSLMLQTPIMTLFRLPPLLKIVVGGFSWLESEPKLTLLLIFFVCECECDCDCEREGEREGERGVKMEEGIVG